MVSSRLLSVRCMLHCMMCPCPVNNVATPSLLPLQDLLPRILRPSWSRHITPPSYLPALSQVSSSISLQHHYPDHLTVPTLILPHHITLQLNSPEADGVEGSSSAVAPCLLSEVCSPGSILSFSCGSTNPVGSAVASLAPPRLPSLSCTQPLSTRAAVPFTCYTRNTAASSAAATNPSA